MNKISISNLEKGINCKTDAFISCHNKQIGGEEKPSIPFLRNRLVSVLVGKLLPQSPERVELLENTRLEIEAEMLSLGIEGIETYKNTRDLALSDVLNRKINQVFALSQVNSLGAVYNGVDVKLGNLLIPVFYDATFEIGGTCYIVEVVWSSQLRQAGKKIESNPMYSPRLAALKLAGEFAYPSTEIQPVVIDVKNQAVIVGNVNLNLVKDTFDVPLDPEYLPNCTNHCESCRFEAICSDWEPPLVCKTEEADSNRVEKSFENFVLTATQEDLCAISEGVVKVEATAGSGKTMAITLRAVSLALCGESVLLLVFSNPAAKELKDRVVKLAETKSICPNGLDLNLIQISTFNNLGDIIIKEHWVETEELPHLASDEEKKAVTVSILNNLSVDEREALIYLGVDLKNLYYKISFNAKGGALKFIELMEKDPVVLKKCFDSAHNPTLMSNIMDELKSRYNRGIRDKNAYTFENQVTALDWALDQNLLEYDHVMVDEFQDSNTQLMNITKKFVNISSSVLVVGDGWQSIFSFRDAMPIYFENFQTSFADVQVYTLDKNYRCADEIQNVANSLKAGKFELPNNGIAETIQKKDLFSTVMSFPENETSVILARSKKELKNIHRELMNQGIPSTLRIPVALTQSHYVKAIIGLGNFLKYGMLADFGIFTKMISGDSFKNGFASYLNAFADKTVADLAEKAIMDFQHGGKEWFLRSIEPLRKDFFGNYFAEKFENMASGQEIIDYIALYSIYNTEELVMFEEDSEGITLTTMHSSKGLEWDNVIIVLNEKDAKKAESSASVTDENSRLLYVALTRAKKKLRVAVG